jgi:thiol:disulfide interchange protein DsbD
MALHLFWLFLQSLLAGLLAVFTPFVYTVLPLTVGYLSKGVNSKAEKIRNLLYYAVSIIIIFTFIGVLVSVIIQSTGLLKYAGHWIFNLFFCRLFLVLGISLLGVFSFKLPQSWVNSMASKARTTNFKGIFYMALTLPGSSFSSTAPIIVLVLVFTAKSGFLGPVIGLFGFAVGLASPFVFPRVANIVFSFRIFLNNVKVVLGFFSLIIGIKFLSNADISLGWHILDREIFIAILILMFLMMGAYMLGKIKMLNDYAPEQNIYRQEYVPLSRLFLAIAAFCFAIYLLPGMWGAPLHVLSNFLPN